MSSYSLRSLAKVCFALLSLAICLTLTTCGGGGPGAPSDQHGLQITAPAVMFDGTDVPWLITWDSGTGPFTVRVLLNGGATSDVAGETVTTRQFAHVFTMICGDPRGYATRTAVVNITDALGVRQQTSLIYTVSTSSSVWSTGELAAGWGMYDFEEQELPLSVSCGPFPANRPFLDMTVTVIVESTLEIMPETFDAGYGDSNPSPVAPVDGIWAQMNASGLTTTTPLNFASQMVPGHPELAAYVFYLAPVGGHAITDGGMLFHVKFHVKSGGTFHCGFYVEDPQMNPMTFYHDGSLIQHLWLDTDNDNPWNTIVI